MNFRLFISKSQNVKYGKNLIYNENNISIETDSLINKWVSKNGETFFLIGKIYFMRKDNEINKDINDYSLLEEFENKKYFEGRFVIIKISKNYDLEVWNDYFSRLDIYWVHSKKKKSLCACSSINLIPKEIDNGNLDQLSLSQSLTLFGSRPLKKQTLYSNIKRLGVNEKLFYNNNDASIQKYEFKPFQTFSKKEVSKLEEYSESLIEAVKLRASMSQNIVYLSSGWDSTSLLAILVHLYGPSKIDCIIGRMYYSERSGIINQFEIDRAKKMADYFNVRLHIVDLNYTNNIDKLIDDIKPIFQGHGFGSITGFNHYLLTKEAKKIAKKDASIFVGEISDGAHNFGFSQYFSIYHPKSHPFREYSDKMATYLFGPTFLKQLIEEKHLDDPVWKIFMLYNEQTQFDEIKTGEIEISFQLLSTFFLSGGRIPLYSKRNTKLLTDFGITQFINQGEMVYLNEFKGKINQNNLYSIYIYLYNSFHWQGGTVATLEYLCDHFGLECHLPFLDINLIKILSEMPESWGRGLDINNTKFPLKWMLQNKIDYPINLQEGPHSYTYDIDPNFSHASELVNASSFRKVYIKALSKPDFINKFDPEIFNVEYIESIIKKYVSNNEMEGDEIVNILNLGKLAILDLI